MASSQNFFVWFCEALICQRDLIPHRTKSRGVSDPQNKTLQGIRPRRTKSCGVSDPAEQSPVGYQTRGTTFKNEYFCKFKKEFKNILGYKFGDYMGSIRGKN
jgi:hypothetical protein